MTDLSLCTYYLSIETVRGYPARVMTLCQEIYLTKIFQEYDL